jgi:hypothetical protein
MFHAEDWPRGSFLATLPAASGDISKMTAPIRLACLLAFSLALAACANKPAGEMPVAAAAPAAAEQADEPPMERSEAAGQCWMKYDRSGGSLENKAKLVDKCIADKMKAK